MIRSAQADAARAGPFHYLSLVVAIAAVVLLAMGVRDALRPKPLPEGVVLDVGDGVWDVHLDAAVGRILRRGIDRVGYEEHPLITNLHGMREAPYALPKPADTVRVVLLGDSFVMGHGAAQQERVGVFLQQALRESSLTTSTIEVLHLGISSWNIEAECSYVRRQLAALRPDLVIHFIVANDLDDVFGVRGVGLMSKFTPQRRERCSVVLRTFPQNRLRAGVTNHLVGGLDLESRERYDAARLELRRLRDTLDECGARYLLASSWIGHEPLVEHLLAPDLDEGQHLALGFGFLNDPRNWVDERNRHWGARGSRRIGEALQEYLRVNQMLPQLELAPRLGSPGALAELIGDQEYLTDLEEWRASWYRRHELTDHIDLDEPGEAGSRAVHGGIQTDGRLAPYASFMIRAEGPTHLVVRGSHLDRKELVGGEARVLVEGVGVGRLALGTGEAFEHRWSLSEVSSDNGIVNVRFVSDDWVYSEKDRSLQTCVTLELDYLGLE